MAYYINMCFFVTVSGTAETVERVLTAPEGSRIELICDVASYGQCNGYSIVHLIINQEFV